LSAASELIFKALLGATIGTLYLLFGEETANAGDEIRGLPTLLITTRPAGAKENAAAGRRKNAANLIVATLLYLLLDGAVVLFVNR